MMKRIAMGINQPPGRLVEETIVVRKSEGTTEKT